MIDDLQFFVGKQRTLEELQHTVDTLLGRRPAARARQRPQPGRASIARPGADFAPGRRLGVRNRAARVRHAAGDPAPACAARCSLTLGDDVLRAVATQIKAGLRELRGALHRLQAKAMPRDSRSRARWPNERLPIWPGTAHGPCGWPTWRRPCATCSASSRRNCAPSAKRRSVSEPRILAMWLARKYTRARVERDRRVLRPPQPQHGHLGPPPRREAHQLACADRPQRPPVRRRRGDPPPGTEAAHGVMRCR